ncbi:MAG TPA: hypothetical protein VM140_12080 [Burkholderiales bacterium]|nr:hypothetical protein [Burkholderiales bacterium]
MKKIFISNFSGLANRLEALVIASLIADRWGHSIFLDWPEKDSLSVAGARNGWIKPWDRIGSLKLRDFDAERLAALGDSRVISLRSTYGPRELQRRCVLPTAARLAPHPRIAEAIREVFARFAGRPAVAVHIRQGDFHVANETYDANAHRHPAPGLWWYEHVMRAYARAFPDVYFVVGYSGEPAALAHLQSQFDVATLPPVFQYRSLLPGHRSAGHPVADLFGLACCTTLIATPTSSFSHWAANVLGPHTRAILPPPRTTRGQPEWGVAEIRGGVALDWRDAAERGLGVTIGGTLPAPTAPVTDWL